MRLYTGVSSNQAKRGELKRNDRRAISQAGCRGFESLHPLHRLRRLLDAEGSNPFTRSTASASNGFSFDLDGSGTSVNTHCATRSLSHKGFRTAKYFQEHRRAPIHITERSGHPANQR